MIADLSPADVAGLRKILTEQVVQGAPSEIAPILERVRLALQETEHGEASAKLNAIAEEIASEDDLRGKLARFMAGTADQVREAVRPLEGAADRVQATASGVAEAEAGLRSALDELPEDQADKIRQALDALDAQGLTGQLGELFERVQSMGGGLSDALDGAQPDDADLAAKLGPLAQVFKSLMGDAEGLGERAAAMRAALASLQEVAAEQAKDVDPRRAKLLLQRAMDAERAAAEQGGQVPEDLWWAAFTVGEAVNDVDVVGQAGFRLIAAAVDAGDMEAVLDLARRRLAVAETAEDVGAGVISRLELGRALSHLGRHDEAAPVFAEAVELAEPTGHRRLIARARLAAAGALQVAGRNPEAEHELRRLMVWFDEDMEGVQDLVARTAMGLAMTLNDVPDKQKQRTQCLRLAASLGHELSDPRIYVPSKVGLVFAANEAGDRALAIAHLVQGRLRAAQFGVGPEQAFTDALVALQEEWGEDALAEALRIHREG